VIPQTQIIPIIFYQLSSPFLQHLTRCVSPQRSLLLAVSEQDHRIVGASIPQSMSTSPIPITPPLQMSSNSTTQSKDTPASSISISPQTPFLPIQNLSTTAPNPNSGILQWAKSFKSPPMQASSTLEPADPAAHQQKGFDIPAIHAHHDEHDSFEFGDLSTRSWGRMGRRAVSMSVPSGQGITGMLSGFGATSPPKHTEGLGIGSPPAQPSSGVMADKTARGQGVLRRLSISSSFVKVCADSGLWEKLTGQPPMFSPPLSSTTPTQPFQPAQQPKSDLTASAPAQNLSPPSAESVQRSNTVGSRGRRLSDSGKKRGVSPVSAVCTSAHVRELISRWEKGSCEITVISRRRWWYCMTRRGCGRHEDWLVPQSIYCHRTPTTRQECASTKRTITMNKCTRLNKKNS
jgi:hypothetical protein